MLSTPPDIYRERSGDDLKKTQTDSFGFFCRPARNVVSPPRHIWDEENIKTKVLSKEGI